MVGHGVQYRLALIGNQSPRQAECAAVGFDAAPHWKSQHHPLYVTNSRLLHCGLDECHHSLLGLHSRSTSVAFISSALITSFLCNQIATWLVELSHSFIPFQSAPLQTANCPLVQSTASLAVLVHLQPGAPAKFLNWRLAICLHRKI